MDNQTLQPVPAKERTITVYEKILAVTIMCCGSGLLIAALIALFIKEIPLKNTAYGFLLGSGIISLGGYAWKNPAYWDRPFGKILKIAIPLLFILSVVIPLMS